MNGINIFYEHVLEACTQNGNATIEDMLSQFRGLGIEGLECPVWRLSAKSETKALFESCGMRAISVYEFFDFPHDSRQVSLHKINNCLETAAFFGADKVLAVPGFVGEGERVEAAREVMCELLSIMCGRARGYGITVTLEDFDDCASPCSTIAGLEYFLQNTEGLRLTFDTGNFAYSLESAEDAYSRLSSYIVHVHLKDRSRDISRFDGSNGKADLAGKMMYPCEAGGGYIGIDGIVRRLICDGYAGSFSIEHFGAVNQLEYAAKSVRNILGKR